MPLAPLFGRILRLIHTSISAWMELRWLTVKRSPKKFKIWMFMQKCRAGSPHFALYRELCIMVFAHFQPASSRPVFRFDSFALNLRFQCRLTKKNKHTLTHPKWLRRQSSSVLKSFSSGGNTKPLELKVNYGNDLTMCCNISQQMFFGLCDGTGQWTGVTSSLLKTLGRTRIADGGLCD